MGSMGATSKIAISVLIATKNRPEELTRCLQSIRSQSMLPREVLVLDDGSDAPKAISAVVDGFGGQLQIRLLQSQQSVGVAAGRNRLLQEATGDWLLTIDDDAYFKQNDALEAFSKRVVQYPDTDVFALKIEDIRKNGQIELMVPFRKRDLRRAPELTEQPQRVSYYLGGAQAFRRSVFSVIGYYSEAFVYGQEEQDLAYRMVREGIQIMYLPDVIVSHKAASSQSGGEARELFYHSRSRILLAHQYLPVIVATVYLTIWLGYYLQRALRLGLLGSFLGGVRSGLKMARAQKRNPLPKQAVEHLRANYGRLWY